MTEIHNIIKDLQPLAVNVELIQVDPENVREGHDLMGIADSLRKYGQRKPVVVNKSKGNVIEAGNGTFQAATQILHWTHIAVVFVEDNDDKNSVGYSLADNRLSDLSYFDPEKLIEMAMGVDDDIPGMNSIREMITAVDQEPEFEEDGEEDDEFKSTLVFTLSPDDYGRFIVIKDALKLKEDEAVFIKMLEQVEKELGL